MLTEKIIGKRKEHSIDLEKRLASVESVLATLSEIEQLPYLENLYLRNNTLRGDIAKLIDELSKLKEIIGNKIPLFRNGTITISIAGLEKSGKTTFINNLLGLNLPTDDSRCTAVSCEIIYHNSEEKSYEVVYNSKEEVLDHAKVYIKYLMKRLVVSQLSAESLDSLDLSGIGKISMLPGLPATRIRDCKAVIDMFQALQEGIKNEGLKKMLGTSRQISEEQLKEYVQHSSEDGRISPEQQLIKVVRIKCRFKGGRNNLRLYDTPGVNDPNPIAMHKTMITAKSETDMMVVLTNTLNKQPDVTAETEELNESLKAHGLEGHICFLVNDRRDIDPSGKLGERYYIKLQNKWGDENVYGPCDVTKPEQVEGVISKISSLVLNSLEKWDKELITDIETAWKNAQQRLEGIKKAIGLFAVGFSREGIAGKQAKLFDEWFNYTESTHSTSPDNHFIQKLLSCMGSIVTSRDGHNSAISDIMKAVEKARGNGLVEIQKWLDVNATVERCQKLLSANVNPDDVLMPGLAELMSQIVNDIAKQAEQIGPEIQKRVCENIAKALDVRWKEGTTRPSVALMGESGTTREENGYAKALNTLCSKFDGNDAEDVRFIVHNLGEIAAISARAGYIMRYELRPALNMLDPFQWSDDRRYPRNRQVCRILAEAGDDTDKVQMDYVSSLMKGFAPEHELYTPVQRDADFQDITSEVLRKLEDIFSRGKRKADGTLGYIAKRLARWKEEYPDLFKDKRSKPTPRTLCVLWLHSVRLLHNKASSTRYSVFYHLLAYTTLLTIDAVLNSNVNRFQMLRDDFLLDACQTLATQRKSKTGWKNALRPYAEIVCGQAWSELQEQKESAAKYEAVLNQLP
ncbi:MAG: dynamin family protein [Akkermansia sp.]|nr:dynamin family protein [Akkermansia sp.]